MEDGKVVVIHSIYINGTGSRGVVSRREVVE